MKTSKLFCGIISLSLLTTSCSPQSEQEVSRTYRKESIVPKSETETSESSDDNSLESGETTESLENSSEEQDFEISFSDNLLIVDYGKTSVYVYKAQYAELADSWGEDWMIYGYTEIKAWCTGNTAHVDHGGTYIPDPIISRDNIENVHVISLKEIDGYEEIANRLDIGEDSQVLCWTYNICDFPQDYGDLNYFKAPVDMSTIQYAHIGAQYIDGLPVYGIDHGIGLGYITYEWSGVVEPSRRADAGILDGLHINPNHTCILGLERSRFSITDTLLSDSPVVDPLTCSDEIRNALLYEPNSMFNSNRYIWDFSVEIYCIELTYIALDTFPRLTIEPESEESRLQHPIYLVPVWEVYYIASNPETSKIVVDGELVINAVTGESLYSDEFGPDNTELYPDLLLPG